MPLHEEDIAFIAQCSQLQKLNLNFTQLSADQLVPLKKINPTQVNFDLRFRI